MSPEDLLVHASLAAGLVSCFHYGVFLVLFISSTYFLVLRRLKSSGSSSIQFTTFLSPIICFNLLVFITVTGVSTYPICFRYVGDGGHNLSWIYNFKLLQTCVIACIQIFEAFLNFNNGTTPGLYYADLSRPAEVAKASFLLGSLIIGDIMIVRSSRSN
ncbi:MAG TPA: hypothetical protein VGO47_06250 [Chlamydiales bacterium]|jgi:hypothetical protein|nr:hypothetical protein [Chlamydiales bacterium]